MNLCFFTDEYSSNFKPLSLTRPLDDFRLGILTLREKWIKLLKPNCWVRQVENHLSEIFPKGEILNNLDCIWINSRFLPNAALIKSIQSFSLNDALVWNDQLIACKITAESTKECLASEQIPSNLNIIQSSDDPKSIKFFWDILAHNADQIAYDITLLSPSFPKKVVNNKSVIIENKEQVFIHESAHIEPNCILIATDGPIYIGPQAVIEAGAILRGPVAVCEKAEIKMAARIFNGTTVGPVCKVGGEVNNCIFHSYSNKAHDGFTGNSIIGQWSNFGANTNTSNLKNNFSLIKLPHWDSGNLYEGGVQFFGTVFSDFSKTAINTRLNTGTICGVSSNIFCSGFPKKIIPSFTWLGEDSTIYDFDKAINAMEAMMKRRGVDLTQEYLRMMRFIFNSEYSSGG